MLRTFLKVRRTSLDKDSCRVTPRLRCTHHLIHLLFKHLLHHQYTSAAMLLPSIASCYYWTPDIIGKCGIAALVHDRGNYSESLQLYKQLYTHTHKLRVEYFLEMVFFLVSSGNTEEALDLFQSVINQEPYRSNPLCRGYCGLLSYIMWSSKREQQVTLGADDPDISSIILASQPSSQAANRYCKMAEQQWKEMIQLLPGSVGVMEYFVHKYVELLNELGRGEESTGVLETYISLCPNSMNTLRLLISHTPTTGGEETELQSLTNEQVQHLIRLAEVDPSCGEVLELVKYYLLQIQPDYQKVFHLLLHYLDYPHNGANCAVAWEQLEQVLTVRPALRGSAEWSGRVKWWRRVYPNRAALLTEQANTDKQQH